MLRLWMAACGLGIGVVLAACASAPGNLAPIPSRQTLAAGASGSDKCGVVAHYIVFVQPHPADSIEVIQVQEVDSYLQAFPKAERLAGATIVYPDGSTQVTQANGAFDAGRSAYARSHPVGKIPHDVRVTVVPPKVGPGSSVSSMVAKIFAPSERQERSICSNVLPSSAITQRVSAVRAPGCDPNLYERKDLLAVQPGRATSLSITAYHTSRSSYLWHATRCGTDAASDAVAWSDQSTFRWFNRSDLTYSFEVKPGFDHERIALWVSGAGTNGSRTFLDVQLAEIVPPASI